MVTLPEVNSPLWTLSTLNTGIGGGSGRCRNILCRDQTPEEPQLAAVFPRAQGLVMVRWTAVVGTVLWVVTGAGGDSGRSIRYVWVRPSEESS